MMSTTNSFAKAEMLIRRPVQEVFEAFINPDITTQIWFTKSTGRLEEGITVMWTWEMYDVTIPVQVKKIEPNQHILLEWGNYNDTTTVSWTFKKLSDDTTFVSIVNVFPKLDAEQALPLVRDSTEGFTLVLANLKALLEHQIRLNLVGDRFPKGI